MNNCSYTFSVITPTFNRAPLLKHVYESLINQTFRDFEWIVVNDGSTDNTEEIVQQLSRSSPFPIQYVYQKNSGLHVARNTGIILSRGLLCIFLDDDDILLSYSLERFWYWWNYIPSNQRAHFAGITALCEDFDTGRLIGDKFPNDIMIATNIQMFYILGIKGDKARCFVTQILKKNLWPNIGRHVTSALVFNRLSKDYLILFVNEVLMKKRRGFTYERLTHKKKKLMMESAFASRLFFKELLEHPLPLRVQIRMMAHYVRYSFHGKVPFSKSLTELSAFHRVLFFLALPLGYWLYRRDLSLLSNKRIEIR